jgi:S1-C subfamily serine protease
MLEDFRAGKRFGKPYIGASAVYIAGDLADALHLPTTGGLLIQEIHSGSPADEAGLKQYHDVVRVGNQRLGVGGDFITAIDGKQVTDVDSLIHAMTRKRPGDDLDLTIFRAGKSMHVKVKLGEAPDSPI